MGRTGLEGACILPEAFALITIFVKCPGPIAVDRARALLLSYEREHHDLVLLDPGCNIVDYLFRDMSGNTVDGRGRLCASLDGHKEVVQAWIALELYI